MPHACTFTMTSSGLSSGSGNSSTSMFSMPLKMAAFTTHSSCCSGAAGRQARAQHLLVDLPGGCLREVVHDVPTRRHLERSEPFPAVLLYVGDVHPVGQHEDRVDLLSAHLVGTADNGSRLDARMLEQDVFDLARVDVL